MANVDANTGTKNDSTSAASQVTDKAMQASSQVADSAKEAATKVGGLAQQQAQSQLKSRKNQAAQTVDSTVNALHQVSQQLRKDNQEPVANVTDLAASQLGRVSDYLENTSVNQMLRDVENVARDQSALFLTGAFALGVVAARFIKSSSSNPTSWSSWQSEHSQSSSQSHQGSQSNRGGSGQTYRQADWQTSSYEGNAQGWTKEQARENWKGGSPYGVYDPGSTGVQVREVPQ